MKRAQYVLSKSVIAGIPIVKIFFQIARQNWGIILFFFIFCSFIYWLFGGIIPLIISVMLLATAFYHIEDCLLYHPDLPPHSRLIVSVPSVFGLPYESVHTKTTDGVKLHLLVILQPDISSQVPTILYLHGNAGNVGHRLQNVAELYQNLKCNIVMLEYRGYGLSKGHPSERGLYLDARAAMDYIASRKDFNHSELIIFGRSLGGAVGIDIATTAVYENKIWCLIIENTFTSIPDMANVLLGWRILKKLPLFCYKSKYMSKWKVNNLKVPTLFLSGQADTLVPPRMMEELHALCSASLKPMIRFPEGSHNETWNCKGYYNAIKTFLLDVRLARSIEAMRCPKNVL